METEKRESKSALLVVTWSVCSPSTLTIQVRILAVDGPFIIKLNLRAVVVAQFSEWVASDTKGSGFKSSHQQLLFGKILLTVEKPKIKKK